MSKNPNRNDPCPCGSGKKYKKCHGAPKEPKKFTASVLSSGDSKASSIMGRISSLSGKVATTAPNQVTSTALENMKNAAAAQKPEEQKLDET